jgi:hypothetical protein
MTTSRLVEVAPERLTGWVGRFGASHGGVAVSLDGAVGAVGAAVVALAGDGARAELEVPWPLLPPSDGDPVAGLVAHAARPRTALLVLVRRGGVAVGLARGGELLDHTSASGYVQARTAAGGWSQQRYARRRSGQAVALASSATEAVLRVLDRAGRLPEVLVPGGDRAMVAAVLLDPRLAAVAALPRGPLLDVADPRLDVLAEAARRARAVRVRVTQG